MDTIKIGDRIVPISGYDANGKPIIKVDTEEIKGPNGRIDVIVKVPFLKVSSKQEEI